ncbi:MULTISPECIES: thiamine diphosphokinase [unclassified Adlercreutzia]|uniref:thiamine diphosphokinase n=1 Tax=unclassified Adlercreutzia TaxID=2636013 RepID=UPI0013EAE93F|nr:MULTISPECIES: thiamine diphosphokinase [unclassified Adlercreutzia]
MRTCALVGASEFNAEHFQEMDAQGAFDFVIAVDGGFAHLEGIGRTPDMALGDFDSLGYVPRGMRVTRFSPDKDQSDMELALQRAKSMRYTDVYVYGGLGGRLDHTLANLQVLALFSERGLFVTAVGEKEAITFVTGPDTLELSAAEAGTVSVLSMSDEARGVFERGLKWELDDFTLSNRTSRGLSNEFAGEAVMIGVESGTIAVLVPLV